MLPMPSWEQVLERRGETVVGGGTWRQRPRYRTIRHGRQGGDLIVDTRPRPPPLIRCFHLETNSRENTAAWMPAADLVATWSFFVLCLLFVHHHLRIGV